tara:strand:+ start:61 stop:381 length:321 start_codon:yes stop_codon:yes gene_type:complete
MKEIKDKIKKIKEYRNEMKQKLIDSNDVDLPHIKYVTGSNNTYIYKKYVGNDDGLIKFKIYRFHTTWYSPDSQTTRRDVWVTKSENNIYIRYEDDKGKWISNVNES